MPQVMSLERFAELTARMTSGETRSDVLQSVHLDEETWEASQQYWLGKMAAEAGRDRYSLAQRYGVLFKAAQKQLARVAPRAIRRRAPVNQRSVVVHAMPGLPAAVPSSDAAAPSASPSSRSSPSLPLSAPSVPASSLATYSARLTLEQLAAMRAEIATAPEGEQSSVLQRFGLDSTTWQTEESHWQRKLAGDENLFKRYLRQFQYCRSLLQRT
jgi:hypothetical protein